jgi:hypothetical protein
MQLGKEVGLEVNSEKTKYMLVSHKKAGRKHGIGPMMVLQNSNIWEQH